LIFAEEETERLLLAESLKEVAFKFKGRVNFATVDARKLSFLAEPFGLRPGEFPAFVMQTSDDTFPFDQRSKITSEVIEKFIREMLGRLARPAKEL
jgi:protein disulfide-isomerase A1